MGTVKKLGLVEHPVVINGWRTAALGFMGIGRAMAEIDAAIASATSPALDDDNAIGWLKEAQLAARQLDEELEKVIALDAPNR
jgi:hypothetical protein